MYSSFYFCDLVLAKGVPICDGTVVDIVVFSIQTIEVIADWKVTTFETQLTKKKNKVPQLSIYHMHTSLYLKYNVDAN